MARTYSFSPGGKAWGTTAANTAATTTSIFTPAEIDSAGVVAFHIVMSNDGTTAQDISIIQRVRVKANGQTVIDLTTEQLRAYQERFSPKGNSNTATGTTLTIPLNSLDAKSDDDGDRCQFMPGASATVEIQAAVTAGGAGITKFGNFFLAWTKTTVAPEFYMTLISQQTNVTGTSTVNGRSPLSGPGFLQGLALPTAGLNRVRVVASGLEVANLPGAAYLTTIGDLFRETQELYENPDDNTMVTSQQFLKLNQGLEVNPATSWLEITTGTGWSNTSEQTLYTLVPVNPQRA